MQDFQYVIRMMFDAERPLNDLGQAFSSPQIGRKARGQRALQKDSHQRFPLPFGQLGRPSRRRLGPQAVEPFASNSFLPASDGRPRNIQCPDDSGVPLARKKKPPGSQTTGFLLRLAS